MNPDCGSCAFYRPQYVKCGKDSIKTKEGPCPLRRRRRASAAGACRFYESGEKGEKGTGPLGAVFEHSVTHL